MSADDISGTGFSPTEQEQVSSSSSTTWAMKDDGGGGRDIEDSDSVMQYFPKTAGQELTLNVNGKTYVISTVVDDESGQLMNIMSLPDEDVLEEGQRLERIELESYDPSDLIIVRENCKFEDEMVLGIEQEESTGTEIIEEYPEIPELEETEIQIHSETGQELLEVPFPLDVEKAERARKRKLRNSRVRNKDIMELPFSYNGQSFTVQAQKLILNVYDFFKRTQRDPYALKKIGTPQEQAAKVLNVSSSVIGRIRNRFKTNGKIITPSQSGVKIKRILDRVDEEKETIIRNIVRDLTKNQASATVANVMRQALARDAFKGSQTSFRRVLRRMKFNHSKIGKTMLIVDPTRDSLDA